MTTPLRIAVVVAVLLASGFTAEHLASQAGSPPPEAASVADAQAASAPVASAPVASAPVASAPVASAQIVSLKAARPEPRALQAAVFPTRRLPMGPVQGPVSSPFGPRVHPVSGRASHHDGVDLAVPAGTAVWTVASGIVRLVGRRSGYGLVVEIDHPGGIGGNGPVRTRYAHLASVDPALRPGLRVGRGVALGASGGVPGRDGVSTGAHLHFEVRDASGQPVDPARVVRLPEAASTGPRWSGPPTTTLAPGAPLVTYAEPVRTDAGEVPSEEDSLASDADLPALVLPDYPTLTPITPTPPDP